MLRQRYLRLALAVFTTTMTYPFFPTSSAQAAAESSPAKTVTVLGKTLALKDTKGGGAGEKFIAEYIPANETFDNFTLMFASRFIPDPHLDPLASAEATANRISARKQSDPLANAAVFKSDDGKSAVVDFLMSQGKVTEHNVFRYFTTPKGLVSLQVARRMYDNDTNDDEIKDFIKTIPTKRVAILKELMRSDLPISDGAK